ncbi:MAG: trypsin-like peptidase domain-containing protein [Pseudonocardiales bacterium]|nr:trypsin-like peptidase domain-containing protein [Pseudonocardiales bacterium]MBV9141734.1 trypsin-like peptidase domain-containing protein [Pseudonocardiales bacterium]
MTRLGEPPLRAGSAAGWPVEVTRSVVQVLDAAGRPAGTGFVVGPQLLVTCAHILTGHERDEPVTVVFAHLDSATRTAQLDPQCWRGPDGADVAFLRVEQPLPAPAQPLAWGGSRMLAHPCGLDQLDPGNVEV